MTALWRWAVYADGAVRGVWRLLAFVVAFVVLGVVGHPLAAAAAAATAGAGLLGPQVAAVFWGGVLTLTAALLAARLTIRVLEPGGWRLGFGWTARTPREIGFGLGLGVGSLAVAVALLLVLGWLRYRQEPGTALGLAGALASGALVLAPAAAAEEALFRGYPFQLAVRGLGAVVATVGFSALFALAHVPNPNVGALALLNIFVAGVLLSAAYLRTRSLWVATALHLGWNWSMASVFDLPVSGLTLIETPLYEPIERGPDWATGGAFGPEAGLAATFAIGLALAAVMRWNVGERE